MIRLEKKILSALAFSACAATAFATTTVPAGTTFDGGGKSFGTTCDGGSESRQPVFLLKDGATLKNAVITKNGADGVHCEGNCTINNAVWQDVCDDAATMKGGSGKTMNITGGSAAAADDKVFQHNGIGSTMNISNFTTTGTGTIGKPWRSCGDCTGNDGPRKLNISHTKLEKVSASVVGVNSNYKDVATIKTLKIKGCTAGKPKACVTYKGVVKGSGSSTQIGEEWSTASCKVTTGDVSWY